MNSIPTRRLMALTSTASVLLLVTACSSSEASEEQATPGTHSVSTQFGTIDVPDEIESVVVIDGRRDLDIALAFDLPIVGMPVETEAPPEIPGALTAPTEALLADGVPELYPRNVVDVESIARVAPDLIIGRDEVVEEIYDQLSTVAPVLPVGSTGSGVTWQQDVQAVGDALNLQDDAQKIIAEYDARVGEIKATHADAIANTVVLPVSTSDEGGISVGRERVPSIALVDIGARFGSAWDAATPEVEYGPENITAAGDADAIIAAITTDEDLRAMNANALWTSLPAVANGRIVRTDKFTNDGGPLTALWTLDLVEQLYAPE
ncbi:ABC transporter substrate-binding protein [Rhodococcus sp. BP-252]|uniref:Fe/B12 periplasmic-binding domain-containing protein n=1 Tax=Rhodococcoides kyotonense TaxID=398843 RepID=A0A177YHZ1_9NOCA|nr:MULTISPECIES: ABC transporter substrate-binding protein [Rhodococcus]MBY6412204.1 ABC transporter substrate-binding protein [Rhodococcus sp. BP-320]MBY6416784.1 ABC transporter substrate-binding protein [Rhodococcus sp. BP-321]MBY6421678.1 ABC transporter substrate-binding protein [Rhodococcus sp. BP-324]MBY6426944.1 ABC transporter substrate-binding protein [Rhodococcus sp. BP-323]MBY6432110.1 ABC transporter substrate-binding protein [Rhodococcus sp. BP-322]